MPRSENSTILSCSSATQSQEATIHKSCDNKDTKTPSSNRNQSMITILESLIQEEVAIDE